MTIEPPDEPDQTGATPRASSDFVVMNPNGEVVYGCLTRDQGSALRTYVPDMSTQGIGTVRVWFPDNFSNPDLHPNPLANQVLARLGYQHPTGWYGPVAVSMEEDMAGYIASLSPGVREIVDELLAPMDGTDIRPTARTVAIDSELLGESTPDAEFDSAPEEFAPPSFEAPGTGAGL
ncbi:hypothetical protein ACIBCD_33930 [Nocardia brasiliensis]|uniref:hypothetical protein n=1 Tax=Nocardia brasiliensis TaxID=37326 RepID=UPI0037AC2C93